MIIGAEDGSFPVDFRFDPNAQIEEFDESEASSVWSTQLEFAKPDVSIVDFMPIPTPLDRSEIGEISACDVGQTYQLRPIIQNTGSLPVADRFEVAINDRDQTFLVTDDRRLQTGETLILCPIEITESEEGGFLIEFVFDPKNLLDESNEADSNKIFSMQLQFQ